MQRGTSREFVVLWHQRQLDSRTPQLQHPKRGCYRMHPKLVDTTRPMEVEQGVNTAAAASEECAAGRYSVAGASGAPAVTVALSHLREQVNAHKSQKEALQLTLQEMLLVQRQNISSVPSRKVLQCRRYRVYALC